MTTVDDATTTDRDRLPVPHARQLRTGDDGGRGVRPAGRRVAPDRAERSLRAQRCEPEARPHHALVRRRRHAARCPAARRARPSGTATGGCAPGRSKARERRDPNTGQADLTVGLANTHIVRHAGRIFALEEGSLPNEISPELDTLGPYDFDGGLRTPFTAHPHVCAETGEMHFFGYELIEAPFVTYHVADAAGRADPQPAHRRRRDPRWSTTSRSAGTMRSSSTCRWSSTSTSRSPARMPFQWSETYGARIGLLHRDGARRGEQPRWFDVDPCYVFHIMNAWESDDGQVVHLDGGRHASMWRGGPDKFEPSYLHRWSFDLRTGAVSEQQLDDVVARVPAHRRSAHRSGEPLRLGGRLAAGFARRHGRPQQHVQVRPARPAQRTMHDFGPDGLDGRACVRTCQ